MPLNRLTQIFTIQCKTIQEIVLVHVQFSQFFQKKKQTRHVETCPQMDAEEEYRQTMYRHDEHLLT